MGETEGEIMFAECGCVLEYLDDEWYVAQYCAQHEV